MKPRSGSLGKLNDEVLDKALKAGKALKVGVLIAPKEEVIVAPNADGLDCQKEASTIPIVFHKVYSSLNNIGSGWITGESFAQTRSPAFVEISSISNATLVLGWGEPNLYHCKVVEILIVTSYISGQQHLVRMNSIFNATQGLVGMNQIFNVARCFLVGTSLSVGQVIDSHSTSSAERVERFYCYSV
ncbi:hypothetical protein LWI29_022927 [Acer saccharum]|uniref:Uncharacterized protein n=1 Tax=Acer saccharum TaxID=4024 RepID=A0AA39RR83_ACESA|nr:hypothetical protein LWI29_022927 [Acer saccharum]